MRLNYEAAHSQKTSGFLGVFWSPNSGRWAARIRLNGLSKSIGYFDSRIKAAIAYDRYAREQGMPVNFPQIVR